MFAAHMVHKTQAQTSHRVCTVLAYTRLTIDRTLLPISENHLLQPTNIHRPNASPSTKSLHANYVTSVNVGVH